jgi:hypothetical protein
LVPAFESSFTEHRDDVLEFHVTMAVKSCEYSLALSWRVCEINDHHSTLGLEDSSHFTRALLASLTRQVMPHSRAEYRIKLGIAKGQLLSGGVSEIHRQACPVSFVVSSGNHFDRGVDRGHDGARSDKSLRCDCEVAGSAADLEYGFARSEPRPTKYVVAKATVPTPGRQPDQKVITERPVQDRPNCVYTAAFGSHESQSPWVSLPTGLGAFQ